MLLVEDNDSEAELFELALGRDGWLRSYHRVRNGEECIAYLKGLPPHKNHVGPNVILLDLMMPGLNGFEVLAWMKKHPDCSVVPVIVFSNSCTDREVKNVYQLGANAFIRKPASLDAFSETLHSIFDFWNRCERVEPVPACR